MSAFLLIYVEGPLPLTIVLHNVHEVQRICTSKQIAAGNVFVKCLERERAAILVFSQNVWKLESFIPTSLLARIVLDVRLELNPLVFEGDVRILLAERICVLFERGLLDHDTQ